MKRLVFLLFLVFSMSQSYGFHSFQDTTQAKVPGKKGFGVTVTQVQPEFPGGPDSLESFLHSNLEYPESAKINHIKGRVYVGFTVDRTGKIKSERILSGVSDDIDKEALRVVKLMPDWIPGTAGGTAVDVQYILPIEFITPPAKQE